jgi:hypothetical protein
MLGITLHEAITGQLPPRSVGARPHPRLTEPWLGLVRHCTRVEPSQRPSATDMLRQLPKAKASKTAPAPAPGRTHSALWRWRRTLFVAGLVGVAAAGGVGTVLWETRPWEEPTTTTTTTAGSDQPQGSLTEVDGRTIDVVTAADLPIALEVTHHCYCEGADPDIMQVKVKVSVTNRSLGSPIDIGGSGMYRLRLLVSPEPVGWRSPWESTTGRPTLVGNFGSTVEGQPDAVWGVPPNPDRQSEVMSPGFRTFATHWPASSLVLDPGENYYDSGNRRGDLVFYLPADAAAQKATVRIFGVGIVDAEGKLIGYTGGMGADTSPNDF